MKGSWFDKLSEESSRSEDPDSSGESEDILIEESDTTNGLDRIPLVPSVNSGQALNLSKDDLAR